MSFHGLIISIIHSEVLMLHKNIFFIGETGKKRLDKWPTFYIYFYVHLNEPFLILVRIKNSLELQTHERDEKGLLRYKKIFKLVAIIKEVYIFLL